MNATDLFNSSQADLPKTRPDGDDGFVKYIERIFSDYIQTIDMLNGGDYLANEIYSNKKSIEDFCKSIINSLISYKQGFPYAAYQILEEAIQLRVADFDRLLAVDNIPAMLAYTYRMRLEEGKKFSKGDLFHIPFQKRHKVSPQRYSIPGVPCLYLSGSLYTCWEELGRPEVNKIHISRFTIAPNAKVRVLNFGYRPKSIAKMIAGHPNEAHHASDMSKFVVAQAVCWPLIAACAIRVKHSDAPFKPEYIIPQLVLQWLRTNRDYDGVRYFSTHIDHDTEDPIAASNFAFPVQSMNEDGHCPILSKKFLLSNPLSWQIAKIAPPTVGNPGNIYFDIQIVPDVVRPYIGTEFELMQSFVGGLICSTV